MSKRRTWWALYWPSKKRLGLWSEMGDQHSLYLYPSKDAAEAACEDWDPKPDGPIAKRVTINVYGEK